jgi:urate oxidase
MPLIRSTYGKGRVRVMRVFREGAYNEVRELTVKVLLEGGFDRSFTHADNSSVVATDTVKNIVNIVARENLRAATEPFSAALALRFLERYPQVEKATVYASETKWNRLEVAGKPHEHSFMLDSNGKPSAKVERTRDGIVYRSGLDAFTFMKSTASGWVNYVMDDYTTLAETRDRMAATAMDASWLWSKAPEDFPTANATLLAKMLEVFATTYSEGVQDSLFRMGEAGLAAVPEIAEISMSCPNKHYIPINLAPFGMSSDNTVFTATDEPHGQIECTVGR